MRVKSVLPLIAAAVVLICLAAWPGSGQRARTAKVVWEYKIVYTSSEDELNKLGADGWELTAAYTQAGQPGAPYCILKRRSN